MWSNVTQTNEEVKAEHKFRVAGKDFSILAVGDSKTEVPAEDSTAHYFKEHDLGFGSDHSGKTLKYTVEHPVWEIHPLKKFEHNVDFGVVYGEKWAFLNEAEPMHTLIAKGSSIKVFGALPLG